MLEPLLAAGLVDQDSPHGLCGRPKEMPATLPMLCLLDIHKFQIRFVHQRRRLQRLTWFLVGQLGRG